MQLGKAIRFKPIPLCACDWNICLALHVRVVSHWNYDDKGMRPRSTELVIGKNDSEATFVDFSCEEIVGKAQFFIGDCDDRRWGKVCKSCGT